jgi:hypothetical protein
VADGCAFPRHARLGVRPSSHLYRVFVPSYRSFAHRVFHLLSFGEVFKMDGHHKEHDVELREMPGSSSTIDRDDAALGRLGKKSVLKVRCLHSC